MADKKTQMRDDQRTLQSNIKYNYKDLTKYSLFLGGLNVKAKALEQYDPLKTGYTRIFFVQMPKFMNHIMEKSTKNFKHMLEYGFKSIDGLQNLTMEYEQITGGYAGRSFEIPTILKDETNAITIKVQEMSGSPVREYIETWLTGISDPHTGLCHYHGAIDDDPVTGNQTMEAIQANQVAEAIYVSTDNTGRNIEFACLLSNMIPKVVKRDHFNYESGTHNAVEYDIEFTCTQYCSPDVNTVAALLLKKYRILTNYLNFKSDYLSAKGNTLVANRFEDANIADWTLGEGENKMNTIR